MKHLVVLTGAGMSAESGFKTFRDSDGLWEKYDVNDICTPEAWAKNKKLVLDFYNGLRSQLEKAKPNAGHYGLAGLEKYFDVDIITQNVDNLHERAGSTRVTHLHGELTKARSTVDDSLIVDVGYSPIRVGDKCPKGSQLRPHIVFYGEAVPMLEKAIHITYSADYFVVIGSSLNVYPAAGLINYAPPYSKFYLVDPKEVNVPYGLKVEVFKTIASEGVKLLTDKLLENEHIKPL